MFPREEQPTCNLDNSKDSIISQHELMNKYNQPLIVPNESYNNSKQYRNSPKTKKRFIFSP